MATIRDVASEAKVSPSTVSHVINGTRYVDPETQMRVRSAIEALGYRPNSLARSLRRRETSTIGLLVPDNASPFFADLSRAIEDAGFAEGYSVVLCNSDGSEAKEATYIDVLISKQVAGLLLISSGSRPDPLQLVLKANVPVVVVDRRLGDLPVDQVLVDNEQGGYRAGQYLLELGHRRIGCITGPSSVILSADRIVGFRRALAEAGASLAPEAIVDGDFHYVGGVAAMHELLRRNLKLTAVFAANDLMAIGVINALIRSKLRVPDDVSVIGFDNIWQSNAVIPSLTTIAQPVAELGQISIKLLLERIENPGKPPTRIMLSTELVERESCRRIAG